MTKQSSLTYNITLSVEKGIRQGDSMCPLKFKIIVDQIIKQLRPLKWYWMEVNVINIPCYAENTVLIAETEDVLQRLVHALIITSDLVYHHNLLLWALGFDSQRRWLNQNLFFKTCHKQTTSKSHWQLIDLPKDKTIQKTQLISWLFRTNMYKKKASLKSREKLH